MPKRVPTIADRRISMRLKRLREATGKDVPDVAETGIVSDSWLYDLEAGRAAPSKRMVVSLANFYGADPDEVRTLAEAADRAATPGWWQAHTPGAPGLMSYVALENDAIQIETYQALVVPGLLQTPEYARAVELEGGPNPDPEAIERAVRFRLERQRAAEDRGVEITAIMDEGALQREVGGPEVRRGQVDHLLALSERAGIDVRIVPYRKGAHPGDRGRFTRLKFADHPPVGYVETLIGEHYLESPSDLAMTEQLFGRLLERSEDIRRFV